MKEKLVALDNAIKDVAMKAKLFEVADRFKQYFGKTLLGRTFQVTRSSLVAAAFICGETAVVKFFDGEDLTCEGRPVSEWLKDCEKVEVK